MANDSPRTYREAIDCLNTLQSNAATLDAAKASGSRLAQYSLHETKEYLHRIGYAPEDLNRLNVLHITGTKGKGSTCAFIDSILRHTSPSLKIGLYTSPHLVAVRERIRVNGKPISEEDFAKFFFEVWDKLEQNTTRKYESTPPKPMYFRMVTLVAFHTFHQLKVDATVLEVGVGGRYDCTNIVPKPLITGITALGIDHVGVLGKSLKEIAWQKAGIYKEGVPAYSVKQPPEALEVLEQAAAAEKASSFTVVQSLAGLSEIQLGVAGQHQYQNANLAVHAARAFLRALPPNMPSDIPNGTASNVPTHTSSRLDSSRDECHLPDTFIAGLRNARWPGRCQSVSDPQRQLVTWFLDGAHTRESLDCCMQWFYSPDVALPRAGESQQARRVLIFNCTAGRNGPSFLGCIVRKAKQQWDLHGRDPAEFSLESLFEHVVFCSNVTYADGGFKGDLTNRVVVEATIDPLRTQRELAEAWKSLVPEFPPERLHVMPSVEHAVRLVSEIIENKEQHDAVNVLVTGSLHLVGGVIEVAGLSEVAL